MTEREQALLAIMLADDAFRKRRRSVALPTPQGRRPYKKRNQLVVELYKKGLSFLEISTQLDVSRSVVAGIVHRNRHKLYNKLSSPEL